MPSAHMGARSTPHHPSQERPAPLFHLQDRYFRETRHPSSPVGRSGHWPSWESGGHPENGRHGVGYRQPSFYVGYPWLAPFGYGLPYAVPTGTTRTRLAAPR